MKSTTPTQYSAAAIALHWLTAILVLIAFATGPGGPEYRVYDATRDFGRQFHETLGLILVALLLIRVLWRAFDTHPEPPPAAQWMNVVAKTVQVSLYLLLFLVPLTAVAGAWLEARPLTLLGPSTVASPLPELHTLGVIVSEIHSLLGFAVMWVAGAHAAAALFHHYVLQDDVLRSMLPQRLARLLPEFERWEPLRQRVLQRFDSLHR